MLADRPDLQREYLGGEVPKAPPIGTFKPGGEESVKAWIDQDRVANGLKPRYAVPISTNTRNMAPALPTSSRTEPAAQDTPDPKNLLEYGPNFGLPEDEGLRQAAAHDAERARQAAQNQRDGSPPDTPDGQPPTADTPTPAGDGRVPPPPAPVPGRHGSPDYTRMTDDELEAAAQEAATRAQRAREGVTYAEKRRNEAADVRAGRNRQAVGNVIGDVAEDVVVDRLKGLGASALSGSRLGARVGMVAGPKGAAVGALGGAAISTAYALGKEGIQFAINNTRLRNATEVLERNRRDGATADEELARIREAQAARRPQDATAQDEIAATPAPEPAERAPAPEQSPAWPGWRRDTQEPMSMRRVREPGLPDRDYSKMSDQELDAAEKEIDEEVSLIKEKRAFVEQKQDTDTRIHETRSHEVGKNIANKALDSIGRETFGQIVRGVAPRGIRGGIRNPGGEGVVVQSAKEAAQYANRESSLENMEEALTDLNEQEAEQQARLQRLQAERAARQQR
ncbi:MAG: hypothetical protein NBV67_18190 [Tagaea sp.]|nr:hypothetical protein [Tagaea sp.]